MESNIKIVYFPMEDKFSIWNNNSHTLIKEWFNTREEAQCWLDNYKKYKEVVNEQSVK